MTKLDQVFYKILRYGLLLTAFTPLVVFRNFFSPFNFGKIIVFRIVLEVLLVLYIYLAAKYSELRTNFFKNPLFISLTLYTIFMALSTFFGVDWHQSFWGYWERMGGLFTWLHYYAFLIILISIFKTKEDWLAILWLSVITAVVSTFYGFFQKFSLDAVLGASARLRIFGTVGNPAAFAGYLLFNFYFALYLLRQYSIKKIKIFLIGAIVLFLAAIFMTAVRGAALAFVVSVSTYLFLDRKRLFKRVNKKLFSYPKVFILSATLVLLFFLVSPYLSQYRYFERLTNFSLNQPTVQQRITVWKIAWNGIKERPLLGGGPENFSVVFSEYYNPKILTFGNEVFDRVHNFIFDILAGQGFIGLLFWLALIAYLFRVFLKSKNYLFCSLIVAYLVHNFFFFDLFSSYLMFFVLLGFGIYSTTEGNPTSFSLHITQKLATWKLCLQVGVAVILFGTLIFYANIKPALANFYSTRGYTLLFKGEGDLGLSYFSKALNNAFWSKQDVYRKLSESYIDFIYSKPQFLKDEDKEFRRKILADMAAWFEKRNQAESFEYAEPLYLYRIYRAHALFADPSAENKQKTTGILEEGIRKLPNALPLYYNLFDLLLEQGEFQKAADLMAKAYDLDKDLNRTKFNMGLVLILTNTQPNIRNSGEIENGFNLIFESVDAGYVSPEKVNSLGKVLEKNKMYPEMLKLYLKLSEKDSRYLVHMSYVYLLLNDRKNTISFADQALVLNYDQIGNQGFRILSEIYKTLGDNKKRSEALLKSAP